MNDDYWKLFEKSGKIDDYLLYACTSEESQLEGREEGGKGEEPGECYWNGFIGDTYW